MDLTVTLDARGFRGVYEAGALDFLLLALEAASAAGVRVRLSRLLCAHVGCVSGVLGTSALTAAHAALPAGFCEGARLPGPNALFHAWVDLPLPHNWAGRALHEAIAGALAHVPHVVLASAGPPTRRLPRFARALVVALSRGALSDAPPELTAGIEGAATRGRAAVGATAGAAAAASARAASRSRLAYGRPRPRDAAFLVLDDARDHRGRRRAPSLSVYTSSLRVEQSWARFRNVAVAAATAPEILAAVLAACHPGLGALLSPAALFRSIAREGAEPWQEKLLRATPRLGEAPPRPPPPPPPPPPQRLWRRAGDAPAAAGHPRSATSEMTAASTFGSFTDDTDSGSDYSADDDDDGPPESWTNVVLSIDTRDAPDPDPAPRAQGLRGGRGAGSAGGGARGGRSGGSGGGSGEGDYLYSSLSVSSDSSSGSSGGGGGGGGGGGKELRFVLRPTSPAGRAPRCLATSVLGPMGAALVKSVRLHDFLLGRHNMQRFLLEELVHPETGESLLPLCGAAAVAVPLPEWPGFDPAQEKSIQRQSSRIWEAFISDWHTAMRSTQVSHTQVLTSVNFAHRPQSVRLKRSLDRLSRGVLARLFFSLTSGIRRAKAKHARDAEQGGGQYLEEG